MSRPSDRASVDISGDCVVAAEEPPHGTECGFCGLSPAEAVAELTRRLDAGEDADIGGSCLARMETEIARALKGRRLAA